MDSPSTRKRLSDLVALKAAGTPISALTCYDYPSACIQDAAGLDIIFVGDSAATNTLGYAHQNELPVEDLRVLLRAVSRGVEQAYLLVDLPYCASRDTAGMRSAANQFSADGANGVKFEGFHPGPVHALNQDGFEVWAHLGYLPQYDSKPVRAGKEPKQAEILFQQAQELEAAGAAGLILELVPGQLAHKIAQATDFPVIGIGAGPNTDGQVQVWHDLIGLNEQKFRHAERLAENRSLQESWVHTYLEKVAKRAIASED
ncbi:MAG: 3-methyl-2-oxobutanoate hydroxymethyltransferase [Opitutia bacterium UBA7350]|nr:MAG: 3-methyl-2-oxobutanoate hydroxymethyltransferase [Opitutae bacterium UBA7350]